MDFGWKKADEDATTSGQTATSVVTPKPDSQPASEKKKEDLTGPLSVPSDVAPDSGKTIADLPTPEKSEPIFEMSKKDDSFSSEVTTDPSVTDSLPQDSSSEASSLSSGSPSDNDYRDPMTPSSIDANKDDEKIDEDTQEEKKPYIASNNISSTNGSLSDLEKKVSDQKETASKELSEIQSKVDKLDELNTKIQKMKDEEQSLIQEISSAL